ncbi:MAG: hypothetical protein QNJ98_05010 [Planctomycetota bacterium]|nr:hypothetical protein [Planctomycetota bacterium]
MRAALRRLPLLLLAGLLVVGPAAADDVGSASVRAMLEQRLTAEQMQEVRFLEHLGWRFLRDADPKVQAIRFEPGFPCRYETLLAAQQDGALVIRFPAQPTDKQLQAFGERLPSISNSVASRCAYKHRIALAVRRAVDRLVRLTEAQRYKFPKYLFGAVDSPWFRMRMPQPEWQLKDRVWVAKDSARAAMDTFYRRGATAECYGGQAIAVFSIQYELYGPEAFDKVFAGDDLAIGRPLDIKSTPLGKLTHWTARFPWRALMIPEKEQRRDSLLVLARHGRMAFVGLSGIVRNQKADVQSNENFIITSISKRALDDAVKGGGLPHFSKQMTQVWEAAAPGRGLLALPSKKRAAAKRVDELLAQPIFTELMLYVHPYGDIPLADIVRKKLEKVDTPLEVVIYAHGREDGLYQRYREAFRKGWLTPSGATRSTEPVPAR